MSSWSGRNPLSEYGFLHVSGESMSHAQQIWKRSVIRGDRERQMSKAMRACRWLCISMTPMLVADGERRCVGRKCHFCSLIG